MEILVLRLFFQCIWFIDHQALSEFRFAICPMSYLSNSFAGFSQIISLASSCRHNRRWRPPSIGKESCPSWIYLIRQVTHQLQGKPYATSMYCPWETPCSTQKAVHSWSWRTGQVHGSWIWFYFLFLDQLHPWFLRSIPSVLRHLMDGEVALQDRQAGPYRISLSTQRFAMLRSIQKSSWPRSDELLYEASLVDEDWKVGQLAINFNFAYLFSKMFIIIWFVNLKLL